MKKVLASSFLVVFLNGSAVFGAPSPFSSAVELQIVKEHRVLSEKDYLKVVKEFPDLASALKVKKKVRKLNYQGGLFTSVEYFGYSLGPEGKVVGLTVNGRSVFVKEGENVNGYVVYRAYDDFVELKKGKRTFKIKRKTASGGKLSSVVPKKFDEGVENGG